MCSIIVDPYRHLFPWACLTLRYFRLRYFVTPFSHHSSSSSLVAHRYSTSTGTRMPRVNQPPRVSEHLLRTRHFMYWIVRGYGSCLAIFGQGWRSFVGINRISPLAIFVEAFAAMTMATTPSTSLRRKQLPPPTHHHQHRLDTHQQ